MLGALIRDWSQRLPLLGVRDRLLLSEVEFSRQVACERVRATRRSIPFCIIAIKLIARDQRRTKTQQMLRLLHHNLRMTDQKGMLEQGQFGILLVDTPEMGGRSAIDRLAEVMRTNNLNVDMKLRVHDPSGFGADDSDGGLPPKSMLRRRGESVDTSDADGFAVCRTGDNAQDAIVAVTHDDPLVRSPLMRMMAKRTVDIVGASVGLTLLSPVILGAMLKIKLEDGAAPVFKQTREGFRGKPFTIYKLRTMVVNAENRQAELRHQSHRDGPAFKIKNDPRITKTGQFLRRTCIDELPQLWNVLKGDMSLVGPRPLPWHESRACVGWHRRRLDVRPGMTCYWQVNKANIESFDDWMRLDLRYLERFGLVEDFRLIFQTIKVPILGRGSE
ncbi:putative sugar transferase EpsL [Rubripirellula tenax]|uniref:Putative sugar transferase EpsL n=1 Tax=Rubripirellula tenax TaxID=2528015 RepID=A0A5C6FG20_9BACT|nr:sugar transferase [Rubripirellula tenax]TWU59124.1 putative sugar transferase EpsL [Rubripirellula tenax]